MTVDTAVSKNLFWDAQPVVRLHIENKGAEAAPPLRYEVHAQEIYFDREAWSVRDAFREIPPGGTADVEETLTVPYGVYRVNWTLADRDGEFQHGALDVARMLPRSYEGGPDAARDYDRRWSNFGGVFGFYAPELAKDMGTRWNRYEDTTWQTYEKERGQFDMQPLKAGLQRWSDAGVECIVFQTLYQRPEFYAPEKADFAPAYGLVMRRAAEAASGLATGFELGNEDNGPTKLLYTEVARHGAAGIRAMQPEAFIANSGTAYIDANWHAMQAARGLYDVLDVACTHPYTAGESAETWKVYELLGDIDALIDRVGGMKLQWTTEFGWPHDFSPQRRAEWIPRHFIIGAAAGVERHGLYTWERDYGVFQGTPQPAAASVHTLMKLMEGHRFAGLLERGDNLWAAVFERAGHAWAVAWSPAGNALWTVSVREDFKVLDLFGNALPVEAKDGAAAVHVTGAPAYVLGITDSVLAEASANECKRARERLAKCLAQEGEAPAEPWTALLSRPEVTGKDLREALESWKPGATISLKEQAIVAQALRWYWIVGRADDSSQPTLSAPLREVRCTTFLIQLTDSVAADVDIPSLRYLLNRWGRLADEEALARACGEDALANRLTVMQETVAHLCACFAEHGARVGFAYWPYLYMNAKDGSLQESLRFVPGQVTPVTLRVNSYGQFERDVSVAISVPEGWSCDPPTVALRTTPGQHPEAQVRIACPQNANGEKPAIRATLCAEGLPDRVTIVDDTFVEAPLDLMLDPVEGLLPQTPLAGHLVSTGAAPLSGLMRVMRKGDTRAVARTRFAGLSAGKPLDIALAFRGDAVPWPYHDWPLEAEFTTANGQRIYRELDVDFACAVRAETPPQIDGKLDEWTRAAPLRLDKIEYARGSFGAKWSPEDCSATTYAMWDDAALYFAAVVKDQTFNQTLTGRDLCKQDSVQIALSRDARTPVTCIGLGLTPRGSELVRCYPEPIDLRGSMLRVVPEQGKITYEAAIPWAELSGIQKPEAGATLRYSVLVNDDDAVTGRRYLERYGGIAPGSDSNQMGRIKLIAETGKNTANDANEGVVFAEDFEEYEPGAPPDAWENVSNLQPVPDTQVAAGAGRNGSKGLRLTNQTGEKPNVFRVIVRPLMAVRPGGSYQMTAWVRGRGVSPGGILGVCTDKWGNEAFSYANLGTVTDTWQEVKLPFDGPSGSRLNIIVRNACRIEELVLDDIRVFNNMK